MIKKKIIVLICFIVSIYLLNAQTITLKGIIKDSLQNPLSYANIIAKPADLSKNLQFAITDTDGLYNL